MTLLGILFVLGVAFMATMNFESQMMVSQSQRHNSDKSAGTMSDDMSGMMGGMMMGSPSVAFSTPSVVDSHGVYAEIPGVQNSVSSIEPLPNPGVDGIIDGFGPGTNDIRNDSTLTAYVNPSSVRGITSSPAPPPPGARDSRPLAVVLNSDPRAKDFVILTAVPPGFQLQCWPATCSKRCTDYGNDCANAGDCKNGDCRVLNLQRCISGPNDGLECADNGDCNPPGVSTFSCEGLRLLDADGDGVSDSIAVDARDFGFTDTQLATLGPQLNPKSKPNGRVSVAFRIVPHGGMVDLNSAHPKLIENALTVPDLHITADVAYGNFKHGPSGPARGLPQYAYPPESEERLLRRRNVLAPLSVAPSRLLGNSFAAAGASNVKTFQGDMPWQLLGPKPGGAASGNYQSVDPSDPFSHRYWPYSFQVVGNGIEKEAYSRSMQDVSAWEAKMEPNAAAVAEPATASDPLPAYNRNHLVTALSYDGLLQRGGRWGSNPNSSPADDLIARMASANFTASDPDCVAVQQSTLPLQLHVLPFEYPDYPDSIVDECCVTDPACKLNPRKGRLQLSLESLQSTCSGGPNAGKTCRNNSANQKSGGCGAPGICRGILVPPDPTNLNLANLAVVEFYHRMQRVVYDVFAMLLNNALSTPYFADISCNPSGANPDVDCSAGEYCDAPVGATAGVCRDVWTNQRHSINQLTRTAASLTANLIDYADADDNPTRIAIRDLDFNEADPRCDVGANAGQVCKLGSPSDCPGGVCVDKRNQLGREVRTCDGGSKANKVCQNTGDCLGGQCINLHYMYGVEKQPFITEVATYA
ncbi:MAG: hypothetical protein HYR83_02040, partial [Planctomycetes bacterium]|nr:hypothetical protein [Planctomycetota bacterium]